MVTQLVREEKAKPSTPALLYKLCRSSECSLLLCPFLSFSPTGTPFFHLFQLLSGLWPDYTTWSIHPRNSSTQWGYWRFGLHFTTATYPVNNSLLSYHIARTPKRSARATILSVQRISRSSLYPISITSIHDQGNNRRTWSGIRILLRMSSPSTRVLSPSHNYPHLVSVYSVDLAHMCELLVMLRYWSRTVSIQ
jgi:hypothetical protein